MPAYDRISPSSPPEIQDTRTELKYAQHLTLEPQYNLTCSLRFHAQEFACQRCRPSEELQDNKQL